jgi:predicted aminopeptidase
MRKFFILLMFFATGLFIWKFDLVAYGLRQLRGQLLIVSKAEDIHVIMKDPSTPDSVRKKLNLINEVRKFAVDSLGLKNSRNYTTYYSQGNKPAIWVITACEPFALQAYEWQFPFLGSVSYKGFFEKERGLPEVNTLRRKGYDVEYSPAGGWSTLGWFRDPVLSGMLRRNEGQLAELIIHELTHATIYRKGEVEFNENLATFIGETGALKFLSSYYGDESRELRKYTDELHDEKLFGNYMIEACNELDKFYDSLPDVLPLSDKYLAKYRYISVLVTGINKLPLKQPEKYRFDLPEDKLPDNTYFMGYRRYRGDLKDIELLYNQNDNDIRKLILKLK